MINEQSFCRGGGAAENAKPRITVKSEGRKKPKAAPVAGRGLFQSAKAGSGDQSAEAAVAAIEKVSDRAPMAKTVQWAARVRRSFSAMRMILSLMSGSLGSRPGRWAFRLDPISGQIAARLRWTWCGKGAISVPFHGVLG